MRGHIVKRAKDSYSIKISIGKDSMGKYKYLWRTVKGNKTEAQKRLNELLSQMDNGTLSNPKGKLGEFINQWLTDARPHLSITTYQGYESIYRTGIAPRLGTISLKDLRPAHIQEYITKKLATGVSNTTVRHQLTFLHTVLETAVKWQLIARNPVDAVLKPKIVKHEMITLNVEQAERVLSELEKTKYYPLFVLALYCGMRQSELLPLQWKDVDLSGAELTINKASHRLHAGGEYVLQDTKTEKSNRILPLSSDTCNILRQHLENEKALCAKLGIKFTDDRLLFCEFGGKPLKPGTVSQYWQRLIKRLNYPHIRFHDLRHTMATLMFKEGENVIGISERLGHSNRTTTLNTYAHGSSEMQRKAAEHFDEIFTLRHEKASVLKYSSKLVA
jgi:integrase